MPATLRQEEDENRTVVKKVRFTPTEAEELEDLAESAGTTQSAVLREGFRALLRMQKRRANIDLLINLIDGEEPRKIPFEGRA